MAFRTHDTETRNQYRGKGHAYPLSEYQQGVVDWLLDGKGHAVVEAVAGSGKTTTLLSLAKYIRESALFLAFNKHIATELNDRLSLTSVTASTIHSAGFAAIRRKFGRVRVDGSKYWKLCRDLERSSIRRHRVGDMSLSQLTVEDLRDLQPARDLRKLADLARLQLVDLEDNDAIRSIAYEHDMVDLWPVLDWACEGVRQVVRQGNRDTHTIDFTDMIYLPAHLGLTGDQYAWVFVDECQDLSPAQLATARLQCATGGRMLFVGDSNQAIYGFAGADVDSVDTIVEETGAETLPLSICYRCPTSHLDLARELVPQVENAPNAEEGEVVDLEEDDLPEHLTGGDLVLCRITAPLVKLCFNLIKDGVFARIRGREIGEQLARIVKRISDRPGYRFAEFSRHLRAWESEEVKTIMIRNHGDEDDPAIHAVQDKAEAIMELYAHCKPDSTDGLVREIKALFSDDRPSVWLSTVHRAKGLEADNVYILCPDLLPFPRAKKAWQRRQEYNLKYVALTRATHRLGFVHSAR